MGCVEKACIWPEAENGYCTHHARMFQEVAGRYASITHWYRKKAPIQSDPTGELPHVLLMGTVFNRKDKEPFEKSGFSLLGALEYHQSTDTVRCHECGTQHIRLGAHVHFVHKMTAKAYRCKHGFSGRTALCGLFMERSSGWKGLRKYSMNSKRAKVLNPKAMKAFAELDNGRYSVEAMNAQNKCRVQLLARIRKIADDLGHRPSQTYLCEQHQITPQVLNTTFGSAAEGIRLALEGERQILQHRT